MELTVNLPAAGQVTRAATAVMTPAAPAVTATAILTALATLLATGAAGGGRFPALLSFVFSHWVCFSLSTSSRCARVSAEALELRLVNQLKGSEQEEAPD